MKEKIAISACLLGESCRYDNNDNKNEILLDMLKEYELIPFCPEDFCFGTPRPTMDLIEYPDTPKAISNLTAADMSTPILKYAKAFFDTHNDIKLFIGKDRSPSCGVHSAKLYDKDKNLISTKESGLMAKCSIDRGIESWDAELYIREKSYTP